MRTLKKFPEALTHDLKIEIKTGAEQLRDEMSANAPKDTGQLALDADAVISRDGLTARVGYDDRAAGFKKEWKRHGYLAIFKEYGTVKTPATPFVRPSYHFMLPKILSGIQAAVTKTIQKASSGNW